VLERNGQPVEDGGQPVESSDPSNCGCCSDADCTACGGTCDDSLDTVTVDMSDLSRCSGCTDDTDTSSLDLSRTNTCPHVTWDTIKNSWSPRIIWDDSENCYVLDIICDGDPVGIRAWKGCKGGDSPVGDYGRNASCTTNDDVDIVTVS